ncbi:hypothetical protein CN378_12015 [Bacillus sp. AFS015802]|uniref:hypothetical protein n=1 Tax=Bacillus sp. AFS015802 TaxID=2033486 RepID=UPI000BF581B5|nr:hypothetical protein [Bacillus sp. AFS015802]PFA67095.1 hypothetical protein CN378_12015 [Bacillus sp. AFS015802]
MLHEKVLQELHDFVATMREIRIYDIEKEEAFFRDSLYSSELDEFIEMHKSPSFSEKLFQHIDGKGETDASIYKKAGVDRKHFSKIRSIPDYKPSKRTVVALCLSLELSEKDTEDLLSAAGFSLSDSDRFDLVIQFCLEKKIYDIDDVNQALNSLNLKPL